MSKQREYAARYWEAPFKPDMLTTMAKRRAVMLRSWRRVDHAVHGHHRRSFRKKRAKRR